MFRFYGIILAQIIIQWNRISNVNYILLSLHHQCPEAVDDYVNVSSVNTLITTAFIEGIVENLDSSLRTQGEGS